MADQKPTQISRVVDGTTLTQALAIDASGRITELNSAAILTALQLIDDIIIADDAAFTPGTTKVAMVGFEFDDDTPDSVGEGDAGAARMSANRNIYVQIRDAAGNERGLNVDASGQIAVTGAVTVSATNLDIRDLTQATDTIAIWTNTAPDGSGTDRQPITDNDGHLQVDILSGAGSNTPTSPLWDTTNVDTPINLAAGASDDADSADLPGKFLHQVIITSSVAFKAILGTLDDSTFDARVVMFGGPNHPVIFTPPHQNWMEAPAAGTGTQGWRTVLTNMDTSETADFYVSYAYANN